MLQPIKSAGRRLLAELHDRSPRVLERLQGRVLILGYHRVLAADDVCRHVVQPGMYVHDHVFEAHVRFLREHFRIITFTEFLRRQRTREWEGRERYCLITFDDGWVDNYVSAYPILRGYQIP